MPPIAMRNLFHDKHKLLLAVVGILFSVVLVTLQFGLFINAIHNASGLIDNSGADIWIMQEGTRNIDMSEVISNRRYYQAITTPGVAWAERLIVHWCPWKLPDGQQSTIEIVGIEPNSRLNLPWGMAEGRREEMFDENGIIIDQRERNRFSSKGRRLAINDQTEISYRKARVAGFSEGVGTFTMAPYVFTSFKQARDYAHMKPGEIKYVVLKAESGVSQEELRDRLRQSMTGVDIYTAPEFAFITRWHWMIHTGVGLGILVGTGLSLIVGVVIVGQTMYSATIERLKEYGTLKALGMSNMSVASIIVRQAVVTGLIGYVIGTVLAYQIGGKLPEYNVPVEVPFSAMALMFVITVGMCILASVTSIIRVFRLEPAIVFRD